MSLYLPWSVQANCANVAAARLMSKLLRINSRYNGWYGAKCIAVWPMPDKQHQKEAVDVYRPNTSKVQYIHDIKAEGHIPPNTTKYAHIRRFTSKQIKLTWY